MDVIKKGQQIIMKNGQSGINVRQDTAICPWGRRSMMIEAPIRVKGGRIEAERIGRLHILMRIYILEQRNLLVDFALLVPM